MSTETLLPYLDGTRSPAGGVPEESDTFRFYDSRQRYLMFVTTCGEKSVIARRIGQELAYSTPIRPQCAYSTLASAPTARRPG